MPRGMYQRKPMSLVQKRKLAEAVEIYAYGMVYMSVCAKNSIPIDAIISEANRKHPTGIEQPWALSSDKTFHEGKSNPCPCDKEPGRIHYLLSC